MINQAISGIILAGGKSSRMGADKGLLILKGKTFVEHIAHALSPFVKSILIIANNDLYKQFGYPVYADICKDCGPMGGIYTGLMHSLTEKNIVVSCDTPFINRRIVSKLISSKNLSGVVVPEHNGLVEPLCAIYSKECIPQYKQLLEQKEWSMKESLSYFEVLKIKFDNRKWVEKSFANINTREDFFLQTKTAI